MKKKLLVSILVVISVICVYGGYKYNQFQQFGKYVKEANQCVKEEKYTQAIELYNKALANKNDYFVRASLESAEKLLASKNSYLAGEKQISEKKYSDAVESMKKVWVKDRKRYLKAQICIIESYYDLGNMDLAEKYINGIKGLLGKSELAQVMKTLYVREGDFNLNKNNLQAVGFYQKASKYGYELSNSDNYKTAIFSAAVDSFNKDYFYPLERDKFKTYLCSFENKNSYNDVMIATEPVGSGMYSDCYIYKFDGSNYTVLFRNDDEKQPFRSFDYFSSSLMDGYKVMFSSEYSPKKYLVDISTRDGKADKNFYMGDSQGPLWKPVDINKDGIYELQSTVYLDGTSHGDHITNANTYFQYNTSKKNWEFKDYSIEQDSYSKYPVSKLENDFNPGFKVSTCDQAIDVFKSKIGGTDNIKFYSECIIGGGSEIPENVRGKAAYIGSGENSLDTTYCVIKSTGQIYESHVSDYNDNGGYEEVWTLLK